MTLNKLLTPPVWINSPSHICHCIYKELGHDKNDKWQIALFCDIYNEIYTYNSTAQVSIYNPITSI